MYLGHKPAMSMPVDTEFKTTEIFLKTIVSDGAQDE
jgi:hypothetical protein